MPTPQFNPNAAYAVPQFDPSAAYSGASTSQDSAAAPPKAYGFTPGNILSNVGQGLKELGQGTLQGLSDIGGAILPQSMGGDPINDLALVHHIVDPMNAEAAKARFQQAQTGHLTASAAAHGVAAGVPILGPWAADLSGQAARGDVGGALARGATQIYAPKVGGAVLGAVAKAATRAGIPEYLYETALKPSTTLSQADRADMIQTGLDKGIPVSKGGLEKLGDLVDDYNQKIADHIATDPTRPIDPQAVATRADVTKAKFAKQVNAQGDLDAIEASKQQFLKEQGATPGNAAPSMNALDAQEMKQGTYKVLKGKFGEQGSAAVEAQKSLARGIKEELAAQFPELDGLNASESRLLDLQPILERAVNRVGNHQLVGIGTPIVAGAGTAVSGSAKLGAVLGVMKGVLDQPLIKSRLAIALSKGAKIPIGQAMQRVNAYSTGLTSAYGATQSAAPDGSSADPTTR